MSQATQRPTSWRSLIVFVALAWGSHQAWTWWRDTRTAESVQAQVRADDIVMFTTSDCPYCARARAWLERHGVPWRECDIERHEACRRVFEAQGAPGVPLLNVRGRWRLGFDPAWMADTLALKPQG